VLRLAKLTDAEYVLGQVAAGLEDYYLGSGEAPGVWSGRLAAQLGGVGVVQADDLRALIDGRHPVSGEALVGSKPATVQAIDATFSAPKSVSLLWAFASPEVAAAVSIAHVEAVAAALGFVEERAAVTRLQVGGVRRRAATSGWAAATFVHRTSREGDPQLHTHAVIANLVRREDGVWVALDASVLYRWAKAAGSVYQEELRRGLSERLGVGWGPDRNGCREMTGLSEAQLRAFSKRTAQIEAHLATVGGLPADRKGRMQADEAASLATRSRKDRTLSPEHLRGRWYREARTVRLPTGDALLAAVGAPVAPKAIGRAQVRELFDRLVDPESGLCAHESRFAETQVLEAVAAWGAGRLTVTDIQTLTRVFLDSNRVVRLVNQDSSPGPAPSRWSTVNHRRLEDRVLSQLGALQERQVAPLDHVAVRAAIASAARLDDDQAAAVRTLTASGAGLRALIAPAGYGKTTTLATAVDATRRSGRPILAVSTTNQAVSQLRQVGIPAMTVARFALEHADLPAGCVVIVDEFSQLSTRDAEVVLAAAAACPGGQAWMVGDPLQAQPVDAGGLACWLSEQVRQHRVAVAELTVNRRQADPVERQALQVFRHGDVDTSQQLRDQAGWEHHHPDRAEALEAMAAAVLADLEVYGPDRVAALAITHADCEALADRIRADLAAQGVIAGPALEGPGWTAARPYQAGDRLLLHAHVDLDDGRRLTNGTILTVTEVTPAGLAILDSLGQPAQVPSGLVTGRTGDGRPLLSHAWTRTIEGCRAAPGIRCICWPPPLWTATAAMLASPAPSRQPTPGIPAGKVSTTPTTAAAWSASRTPPPPRRSPPPCPGLSPRPSPRWTTLTRSSEIFGPNKTTTAPICVSVPPTGVTASPAPTPPSAPAAGTWPSGRTVCPTGKPSRPPPRPGAASAPAAASSTTTPALTSTP
jgi:conjugative relaxase-like TrwC/TraI family protein